MGITGSPDVERPRRNLLVQENRSIIGLVLLDRYLVSRNDDCETSSNSKLSNLRSFNSVMAIIHYGIER